MLLRKSGNWQRIIERQVLTLRCLLIIAVVVLRYQKINSLTKKKLKKRELRWNIFAGLLAILACLALGMIFMFLKVTQC